MINPKLEELLIIQRIRQFIDKWNHDRLSQNTKLTIDVVRYLNNEIRWNWQSLSYNPSVIRKFSKDVLENSDLPWDPKYVSQNPSITIDDVFTQREIGTFYM